MEEDKISVDEKLDSVSQSMASSGRRKHHFNLDISKDEFVSLDVDKINITILKTDK